MNGGVSANAGRNHALDAARGILMMLGVLIHAANIYSTDASWIVADTQRSIFFDLLANAIQVSRMPAFFWISGYFCALTFARSGSDGLLRKRLPRLLLPLLTTWATLNVAQLLIVAALTGEDSGRALSAGVPLYHLWFLIDLAVFIGVAALLLPLARRYGRLPQRLEELPLALLIVLLAGFGVAASVAARASGVAYDPLFGLTNLYRLARYAPFFVVGIVMYGDAGLRQRFLSVPRWLGVVALPTAIYADAYVKAADPVISEAANMLVQAMIWLCVAVVLRLFHDSVRSGSRVTAFLSDSAYTVYLFHHLVVVVAGLMLLDYPLGAWPKFAIVAASGLGVAIAVHVAFVRRNRVARLLFNGK